MRSDAAEQRRANRNLLVGRFRLLCGDLHHVGAWKGRDRPRDNAAWRHAFVATFPGASNDDRPMAEEAAAWAALTPTFVQIGPNDALTDLDRILDDHDDVYIGPPNAAWLIYQELSPRKVRVSLDGHGADELMGAYRQEGQSRAFRLRNALEGLSSHSQWSEDGAAARPTVAGRCGTSACFGPSSQPVASDIVGVSNLTDKTAEDG
jgi:asparagine synthetase B (glutamine-hydrolysing)